MVQIESNLLDSLIHILKHELSSPFELYIRVPYSREAMRKRGENMPDIKIIYWNLQDFGSNSLQRGNYVPLCNFIAQVVVNVNADILCLMELKQFFNFPLAQLQLALINAFGGTCDWYCDLVPGALNYNGLAGLPYNPNDVDFTNAARNEGYAIFWKQNIDKFIMQPAGRIDSVAATPNTLPAPAAGFIPNTQSRRVRARAAPPIGLNILPGAITVPAAGAGVIQYTLPVGTIAGPAVPGGTPGGIRRGPGFVVAPGLATAGAMNLNAGDIISTGTVIGPTGLQLAQLVLGVPPILVPGNYVVTTDLTLPIAGTILVPQHVLSLVLLGRTIDGGGIAAPYTPGGVNNWQLLHFVGTAGTILWNGCRRPAYCTIHVAPFGPPVVPPQLIPITMYHAPLANPLQATARCSLSQSLYMADNPAAVAPPSPYIDAVASIVGGDFNLRLDPTSPVYTSYTNNFVAGGAGCNIRANNPPPVVVPAFPPTVLPTTVADNPLNKSTIQLTHPVIGGQPVLSITTDHYRRLAIDNIFYRGFTPLTAPPHVFGNIYDLLQAVSNGVPPAANFLIPLGIIQAFAQLPVFNPPAGGGPVAPAVINNNVLNAAWLLQDILAGAFVGIGPFAPAGPFAGPLPLPLTITPARRAAEFLRTFVSDHLPVIFQMSL
jgi:hypothetical protein